MTGSGGIAAVSAGIAEALVTTALGLFVAIPAVWLFNIFMNKIERFQVEMSNSPQRADRLLHQAPRRRRATQRRNRSARSHSMGMGGGGAPRQAPERHQRHAAGRRLPRSSHHLHGRHAPAPEGRQRPDPADRQSGQEARERKQKLISGRVRRPRPATTWTPKPLSKAEFQTGARRALPAQPLGRARHQGGPAAEVRRRQGSHSR